MSATIEHGVRVSESASVGTFERVQRAFSSVAESPLARMCAVVALYATPAFWCLRRFKIVDPDIWWHLATGRWILQHHALPVTDPFSAYGATRPWLVYSWVFDVAMQLLYHWFGLVGVVLYEVAIRVAVPVVLYHLVRLLLPNFWRAVAVTAVSLFAVSHILSPRPGMFTVLFAIIELQVLLSVRRTGATKKLWLLPLLFIPWANIHVQFVYGLMLLGVFAAEPILTQIVRRAPVQSAFAQTKYFWIALAACTVATFVNPYGPKVYSTVFEYLHQPKSYALVLELKAMNFREPQHFVAAFLALAAAMAIGWRRETRLLWPILLSIASVVAFRSVKEIWFLGVIAACALADGWYPLNIERSAEARISWRDRAFVGVAVLATLVLSFRRYDVSNSWLDMQVAGTFPEAASQFIEKHHLRGSLYNDFTWGGYLIWRLPEFRVSADGRTNVQGDDRVAQDAAVWNGKPEWEKDQELANANVVVAPIRYALTSILKRDPRFKLVYEDRDAAVFQSR
jgi:hypothetical protein